jgi:putative NIF3 family GTP cyclohydrolase 1 type 2
MHLNLDGAEDGIDESLMRGVCLAAGGETGKVSVMHLLTGGGYGRAYDVNETDAKTLFEGLKKELGANNAYLFDAGKKIRRVASFCGAGADESSVKFALSQGADAVVSSDFKHHILLALVEAGISVIAPTHHAAEEYGFRKFYEKISQSLGVCCAFCADERLL